MRPGGDRANHGRGARVGRRGVGGAQRGLLLGLLAGPLAGGLQVLLRALPLVIGPEHAHGHELPGDRADRVVEGVEPVAAQVIAVQLRLGADPESAGAEAQGLKLVEPSASDGGMLGADVRKNIFQDPGILVRHTVKAFVLEQRG